MWEPRGSVLTSLSGSSSGPNIPYCYYYCVTNKNVYTECLSTTNSTPQGLNKDPDRSTTQVLRIIPHRPTQPFYGSEA